MRADNVYMYLIAGQWQPTNH